MTSTDKLLLTHGQREIDTQALHSSMPAIFPSFGIGHASAISPISNPWHMKHSGENQKNDDSGHSSIGSDQAYRGHRGTRQTKTTRRQDLLYWVKAYFQVLTLKKIINWIPIADDTNIRWHYHTIWPDDLLRNAMRVEVVNTFLTREINVHKFELIQFLLISSR